MRQILNNCIVLKGPDLIPCRCQSLVIENGLITEIRGDEEIKEISAGSLVVMPGMYNGHTHVGDCFLPDGATGMTLEEGFFRPNGYKYRRLSTVDPKFHESQVEAFLRSMAHSGTIGHFDFREQGVHGAELLRRCSEKTGLRSYILGQLNTIPFSTEALDQNAKDLPPEAKAEYEAILSVADGISESTMNDLTDPAWNWIREITVSKRKLKAIHCLENDGYRDESLRTTGVGDLKRAIEQLDPDLIIHLTVATKSEIELLVASGKTGVINPRANANLGLPIPPIRNLLEAKANLMLGTDNGLLNSPNLFAELDFTYKCAKSQFGNAIDPNPVEILKMVTSNVRALNLPNTFGYLEEGLPADLTVLDFHASHLRQSKNLHASIVTRITPCDVLCTMREGRYLYLNSQFNFSS